MLHVCSITCSCYACVILHVSLHCHVTCVMLHVCSITCVMLHVCSITCINTLSCYMCVLLHVSLHCHVTCVFYYMCVMLHVCHITCVCRYVVSQLGGAVERSSSLSYELSAAHLQTARQSNFIALGELQQGSFQHRALLFKVSCTGSHTGSFSERAKLAVDLGMLDIGCTLFFLFCFCGGGLDLLDGCSAGRL